VAADAGSLFSPNPVASDVWGQDGAAYAVAIAGGNVYAAGSFTNAVDGTTFVPRSNLMAVDPTGATLLPFAPSTNATVRAMAVDGGSIYIGGDFTTVNGQPRSHLAKLDLDGNLDPNFKVSVPKTVRDLAVDPSTHHIYLVGDFGKIGTTVRKYAAAVDSSGGLTGFNPVMGGRTYAVALRGSTVYLGGNFLTVGGVSRSYLAAVRATDGALQAPIFKNVGDVILDVAVNPNGKQVFGAGGGGFNSAAAWNTDPAAGNDFGKRMWVQRADGDVQAVAYSNHGVAGAVGNVYFGFHDGLGGNNKLRLLAADAQLGTLMWQMPPISGGTPGVVTLTTNDSILVVGGKFPKMGTIKVKGLSIHR
jgi:hypothetical protein